MSQPPGPARPPTVVSACPTAGPSRPSADKLRSPPCPSTPSRSPPPASPALAPPPPASPRPTADGAFRLPTGCTATPPGRQLPLTDLPLNILPPADGKHRMLSGRSVSVTCRPTGVTVQPLGR